MTKRQPHPDHPLPLKWELVATVTARFRRPRSLSIFTLIIAFVAIM